MSIISHPVLLFDDLGNPLNGATVVIYSVTDKLGVLIANHGATVNIAGSNCSVDYDPLAKGEAWITLNVTKIGTQITKGNAFPAIFASLNSSQLMSIQSQTDKLHFLGNNILSSPQTNVNLNLNQFVPFVNTPHTIGDSLNAARAHGFGKWVIAGTNLTLYADDGITPVRIFVLDSSTAPTQRI